MSAVVCHVRGLCYTTNARRSTLSDSHWHCGCRACFPSLAHICDRCCSMPLFHTVGLEITEQVTIRLQDQQIVCVDGVTIQLQAAIETVERRVLLIRLGVDGGGGGITRTANGLCLGACLGQNDRALA